MTAERDRMIPVAMIDPEWAKRQMILLTREWYMHPSGQMPAYEWAFDDVNPPVHAWAAWRVYKISRDVTGEADTEFLEKIFHKMLLNFTWWVNQKDEDGNNIFQGGFLGLDNIGVFDRSDELPTGGHLEQADGTVAPNGFVHLGRFYLEGTVPVWIYGCGDALLEKRVWMEQGANTTYVQYRLARARGPLTLHVKGFVNHRSHHATTEAGNWKMAVTPGADGLRVRADDDAAPVFLRSDAASIQPAHTWYRDVHLATEAARGLDHRDDSLHAATAEAQLSPGASVTLTLSTKSDAALDGAAARDRRATRDDTLVQRAELDPAPADVQHLARSADQFVVSRHTADDPDGRTWPRRFSGPTAGTWIRA